MFIGFMIMMVLSTLFLDKFFKKFSYFRALAYLARAYKSNRKTFYKVLENVQKGIDLNAIKRARQKEIAIVLFFGWLICGFFLALSADTYIKVSDKNISFNTFFQLWETKYDWEKVEKITLTVTPYRDDEAQDGYSLDINFGLLLKNGQTKYIMGGSSIHGISIFDPSGDDLKKIVELAYKKGVSIDAPMPDSKYTDRLNTKELRDMYDFVIYACKLSVL